jgi:hypothetical protein
MDTKYDYILYTLTVQNIRNPTFCSFKSLNLSGHGLHKVSKAFHRDAGPCWLLSVPQLCQVGWMSFGWWTILNTHGKNPAALQILTQTGASGTYYQTPRSKALKCFVLPLHPLNDTHTQSMSQLSHWLRNPSLTCLLPFIYTDWSGFNEWHQ